MNSRHGGDVDLFYIVRKTVMHNTEEGEGFGSRMPYDAMAREDKMTHAQTARVPARPSTSVVRAGMVRLSNKRNMTVWQRHSPVLHRASWITFTVVSKANAFGIIQHEEELYSCSYHKLFLRVSGSCFLALGVMMHQC